MDNGTVRFSTYNWDGSRTEHTFSSPEALLALFYTGRIEIGDMAGIAGQSVRIGQSNYYTAFFNDIINMVSFDYWDNVIKEKGFVIDDPEAELER